MKNKKILSILLKQKSKKDIINALRVHRANMEKNITPYKT
ncbi:hypothetical protein SPSPH_044940 [Sporomusa sphaeroides DSM 2875]|uniref:Uncharacterized protein n=1 Tax=Sporomusa sphaeroides DSM 2875 TaxID=1337886 RepID=A0ABM9VZU1_9FIRM|nr:hypothetical protein SPSPH_27200 [Sporomusa sphaeroides DSM 2875]CVK18422.1 hypothetical protein SSPH_01060 [Sporomusa sphaeroides DSM 2875]